MKKKYFNITIVTLLLLSVIGHSQEKKIKFNRGVLKICSSKNFDIKGYDGDEVVIKSLHKNEVSKVFRTSGQGTTSYSYSNGKGLKKIDSQYPNTKTIRGTVFYFQDSERKKGLKKLGKKNENSELGIYFSIEEKNGELIFRDFTSQKGQLVMFGNERYEVMIPNSIRLDWKTNACDQDEKLDRKGTVFFNSNPSSLEDFNGEVVIQSTLGNLKLTDVVGPVTINTVGGNVTVEFDKKRPEKLYSIYTNNGFIDIQLPSKTSLMADVTGKSVYTDVDFDILEEKEENDFGHIKTKMRLKLGSGKIRMKLDANYGNIYLRKK